jgi:hypothetical protein
MTKLQKKCIVIVAGIFATYLFTQFLRIPPPIGYYISGWVFSEAIIAALAWIFGAVTGGAVSLIRQIILEISFRQGFFNFDSLLRILIYGSYGFLIGLIFGNKTIKTDGKNIFVNLGLFSLSAAGLYYVIYIIYIFYSSITKGFHASNFFNVFFLSSITNSIFIGVISFAILLFYCKYLKFNIPFFPVESKPVETVQIPVKVKKSSILLSLSITLLVQDIALICSQILISIPVFILLAVFWYSIWGILLYIIQKKFSYKKIFPHVLLMIINPIIIGLIFFASLSSENYFLGIIWNFLFDSFVFVDRLSWLLFFFIIFLPLSAILMPISFFLTHKYFIKKELKK